MAGKYEFEYSKPSASRCDCCGGLTVRLTRFVYRDGDAFAIYYAAYCNNHPDNELAMLISLGEWEEDGDPEQRAAFYCRIRPTDDSYEVMLGDAAQSTWGDLQIIGQKLSREEALRHPWKAAAFEVLDEAMLDDRSLQGFMHRVQCGDAAVPLERNFQLPDDVFALGDEKNTRAAYNRNFASLDGQRFFMRCLLPVPVEGYGTWCIGLWLEVTKADHDRARETQDDPESYSRLRFSGALANHVGADLGLPVDLGAELQIYVPDTSERPRVEAPASGELASFLKNEWSKTAFEEFAVAQGIL